MNPWLKWLYGLLAAFIGGGATSIAAGVASSVTDPKDFNLGGGLHHVLVLMGVTFLIAGITHAAMYLSQSPLPREVWTGPERAEAKAAASGGGQ